MLHVKTLYVCVCGRGGEMCIHTIEMIRGTKGGNGRASDM